MSILPISEDHTRRSRPHVYSLPTRIYMSNIKFMSTARTAAVAQHWRMEMIYCRPFVWLQRCASETLMKEPTLPVLLICMCHRALLPCSRTDYAIHLVCLSVCLSVSCLPMKNKMLNKGEQTFSWTDADSSRPIKGRISNLHDFEPRFHIFRRTIYILLYRYLTRLILKPGQ